MSQNKTIAVILSGSGVFDGSEIHEATLCMLAIQKAGFSYALFAPDVEQMHVINHLTGEEMPEKRNVLIESARIGRGKVQNLREYRANDFAALVLPGGFGAAKNLSDFAVKGAECTIHKEVERAVQETTQAGKPLGAMCIAPVILSKILGEVKLTIGQDEDVATAIHTMGSLHEKTTHTEVVVDEKNKIVSTPCYMLDANIMQIEQGATNLIKTLEKWL